MTRRSPARRLRERADGEEAFLLDTHVWVWLLAGEMGRMHRSLPPLLERAAERGNLFVSDISCWEIALKVANGRYALGLPLDEWLDRALQAPGVTMLPLDRSALILGAKLTAMHGDPADRWLVPPPSYGNSRCSLPMQRYLNSGRRRG